MSEFSRDEQRALLALSFEQRGDGYIYYRNRWSRGIPVTAAERESYLRIPAMGSRRAWRATIAGRQTLPPRPYGPVGRKLRAAMPLRMGLLGITFGASALVGGFSTLRTAHLLSSTAYSLVFVLAGAAALVFGVAIVTAHIPRRDTD